MIIKELFTVRMDGVALFRVFSDKKVTIIQNETGIEYDEAIDVEDANFTYTETENPIHVDEEEDEDEY